MTNYNISFDITNVRHHKRSVRKAADAVESITVKVEAHDWDEAVDLARTFVKHFVKQI